MNLNKDLVQAVAAIGGSIVVVSFPQPLAVSVPQEVVNHQPLAVNVNNSQPLAGNVNTLQPLAGNSSTSQPLAASMLQPSADVYQKLPVTGNQSAYGDQTANNYVARPPVQTQYYITRVEDIPASLTWMFGSIVEFNRAMAPSVHVWYAAFGVKAHVEVRDSPRSIGLPRLLEADWDRVEAYYDWAVSQGKGRKYANGNNVPTNQAIVCGPGDQYLVRRLQIVEVPLDKEIPDASGSPDILETIDLLDLVVRSHGSPRPRAKLLAIGDINLCRQVFEQVETARFHFNADADRLNGQNALLAGRRTQRISFSVKNPWCAYTRIQNWSMKDLTEAEMNQILRRQIGIKLYARGLALPAGFGVHHKKGRVVQHRDTMQNMPQAARNDYFIANHLGRLFTPVVLTKVVFLEVYKPRVNGVVMTQEPQSQEQVPEPRPSPELPLADRFGNAVLNATAVNEALAANQEQQPTANDDSYEFLDSECGSEFELGNREKFCKCFDQKVTKVAKTIILSLITFFVLVTVGITTESAKFYTWALSTLQFSGVFIGTTIYGSVADKFGRKPTSIFILTSGILMLCLSGLSFEWWHFFLTRFLVGVAIGGSLVVMFTYCMELVLPEQRMALQSYTNGGTARVIFTLICYLFPNWRHASFVSGIFILPALLIVIFILPESPLWLMSKAKLEKWKTSQNRIRKISGLEIVEAPTIKTQEKVGLQSIWKNKQVLTILLTFCFSWYTVSMSSFAIDLNSPTLSGSFFVNQFLFAVVIMCSKFILGIVDLLVPQFDRRMLHNYNQFIAATCFGAAAVLIYLRYENVIVLILSIIGIFTVQYTWDACYLATVESMPTSIRGTVLGICSTMARVGALVSPMLVTLSTFWRPTVYTVLAIFGFINFILAWNFLPETKGVNLAEVNLKQKSKIVPTEA